MALWGLAVALVVTLGGCATPKVHHEEPPPISESTWRQVDRDILAASQTATAQATDYAQDAMEHWMDLVYKRTDSDFIPWFSSYWTRQWLTLKVAWYRMTTEGERDPTINKLAVYLQEEYHDRVLAPVSGKVDPDLVTQKAAELYVQSLKQQIDELPQRYGIPADRLDQHLKDIPAIALEPPSIPRASLYQLVHADPLEDQPAFAALIARIRQESGGLVATSSGPAMSSVAERTGRQLEAELATSGVASALSAVVGRVAGMAISLGVAGFTALAREQERPNMEARLRRNLNAAFDDEWMELMRNPDHGVLGGVHHISGQVEGSLAATAAPSPTVELPEEPAPIRADVVPEEPAPIRADEVPQP